MTDSPAELEAQLRAAQSDVDTAKTATADAQAAFDASGSAADLGRLEKALAAETRAQLHVGRAERLIESRRAQEEADRIASLEAREAELAESLTHDRLVAERLPSLAREFVALEAACAAYLERCAVHAAECERERELRSVRRALGHDVPIPSRVDHGPSAEALNRLLHRLDADTEGLGAYLKLRAFHAERGGVAIAEPEELERARAAAKGTR